MRDIPNRVIWLLGAGTVALLLLGAQLFRITVAESAAWRARAEGQWLRHVPSYGSRGNIYDRKGRALATSEPAFAAVLMNQDPAYVDKILPELSLLLANNDPVKAMEIASFVSRKVRENSRKWNQYQPLTIERKLDPAVVARFMERRNEFPGVTIVSESYRRYPNGSVAGPVLGYVGQISSQELQSPPFKDAGYDGNEVVGKAGLELSYEQELRGKTGRRDVVVDWKGRRVNDLDETPPGPGNDLYLTLDLELQKVAEEALIRQIEWIKQQRDPNAKPGHAALVVQEVKTGAILAMASVPAYDPNVMARGFRTAEEWERLTSQPGFSLYNWALQGFAPGSTFKMATGLAGLEAGVVRPYQQIPCPPRWWRFDQPRNWKAYDDGPTDVARALATSCNPYFFEVGYLLGIDRLSSFVGQFGFGKKTGIDLPGELPGVNPTKESYGARWQPGVVAQVAIGQGDVLVTPLQLANYAATIAMNGVRYKPYLVQEVRDPSTGKVIRRHEPEKLDEVRASPEHWRRIHEGMRLTVVSPEGTAYAPFLGFPVPVAAKTGSAETGKGYADALTVAFAPYDDPQIAVSAIITGGAKGSWAAPVIRRVMAAYFGIDDKLPPGVPTYR